MATIDEFIEEFIVAIEFEKQRIFGYNQVLASSGLGLYSKSTIDEVNAALSWSISRLEKLEKTLFAVQELKIHQYPARQVQIAPTEVIEELKARLNQIRLAILEFSSPPVGTLSISEELPI